MENNIINSELFFEKLVCFGPELSAVSQVHVDI